MIPGAFAYHRPKSVNEAVALLADLGEDARPLSGGHSLIPLMKLRLAAPAHLVDLGGIADLKGDPRRRQRRRDRRRRDAARGDRLRPSRARRCRFSREAALQIADPQVRYLGTLGGNVANGDPGNDMPAVMMALNATYELVGKSGSRKVAARDFYHGTYDTALNPGEIVAAIRIPALPAKHGYAYQKLKRKVGDYATAAAAVVLTWEGGKVGAVRDRPHQRRRQAALRRGGGEDRRRLVARRGDGEESGRRRRSDHFAGLRPPRHAAIPHQDGRRDAVPRARPRQIPRRVRETTMAKTHISLKVNGKPVEALVEPRTLLIHFLRDDLRLTGPHIGCETTHCGACTVDLDGKSVKSCTVFAVQADGADVLTIEGMAQADGTLHPLQQAFREHHGLQCGFCTPGMITRAYRLLKENPNPTEDEIRMGISGNLCRCTGYQNIVKAIQAAAAEMAGGQIKEAAE